MTTSLSNEEIKKTAKKILVKYQLCDHCLGRIFAKIESGKTNQRRGEILRDHLDRTKKTEIKNCWLCKGLTSEIPHFTDLISSSLKDYEFEKVKRSAFQYETTEDIKESKAQTSLNRAKEFLTLIEEILLK